ncbi:zinc finger (C2H2 type) family protein [Melia azedarach]|uniref:Zinc finger (C2H2 type) family protein n=1 Tax=Melia azedarach TaxID=155640 RepID=A0ACC1YCL3_MELAZ|nr:zinc finger (C2H2 type) family protein [Melia azedarach]
MTGKAKPKKHTAKEIAMKVDAATTNRGGGKAGLADRSGPREGGTREIRMPSLQNDSAGHQVHADSSRRSSSENPLRRRQAR